MSGGSTSAAVRPLSQLLVPRPYVVESKELVSSDVWILRVTPQDGDLPEFLPAQCSMLGAFGVGEAAISISSPISVRTHHEYTIRDAGPITSALVNTPVGGLITVRGPFGQSWPIESVATGTLLVVAGGLGLAPLRAAIEAGLDLDLERMVVLCGAKDPSQLFYHGEYTRWRTGGAEVNTTVDTSSGDWKGPTGVVTELIGGPAGVQLDWTDTTAFVCGPDVMMHFTARKLIDLGMPASNIWITLERNMQCGNALCGHCQLGPIIVCRDGPVVNYQDIQPFHWISEL